MKFKDGDVVVYNGIGFVDAPNNPRWGGIHGNVTGIVVVKGSPEIYNLPYRVNWSNGTVNSYDAQSLCYLSNPTGEQTSKTEHFDEDLFAL